MIGSQYWTTGISLRYVAPYGTHSPAWSGRIEFFDDGFANDSVPEGRISTEGQLHTRYAVEAGENHEVALTVVVDTLIRDATALGVQFKWPTLYFEGDGENTDWPPPAEWGDVLGRQCARLSWRYAYAMEATTR